MEKGTKYERFTKVRNTKGGEKYIIRIRREHVYTLQLRFSDFEKLKDGQELNIATDTALVRCSYGVLSVWNWDYDSKASFSGTITIISKTKKEIVIEEDVRIRDREGKILIYRTRKTFVPAPKK